MKNLIIKSAILITLISIPLITGLAIYSHNYTIGASIGRGCEVAAEATGNTYKEIMFTLNDLTK